MPPFARVAVLMFAGVSVAAPMPAAAQAKAWKCTASGLQNSEYTGGASAYIHLIGFPSGGTYAVTRQGNVATGTTANGTRFTCRLG